MTTLNVDPIVYATSASNLHSAAVDFHADFQAQMAALSNSREMGGSVGECKEWAASYDELSTEAYNLASSMIRALDNYAGILQQAGYNYALADYAKGTGRPEPIQPSPFPPAWSTCPVPPPSAGGPGNGLIDDGFDLAKEAGVTIPDGDPDKLLAAATTWETLAAKGKASNLPARIEAQAKCFEAITAQDASFIDEDLREMKTAAEDILGLFAEIAQSCRDQKTAIDDMRKQITKLLQDLAADIAEYVVEGVIISVVAGALSAGYGAVAVAAYRAKKIYDKVKAYAEKLKGIYATFKLLRAIKVKNPPTTIRGKLQRIIDLAKRAVKLGAPKRPSHVPDDWEARLADNGKGWVWQKPGSSFNQNTFRDALPTTDYPNGYVRFYNEHGQPLKLDGKPGSNADTHIPKNPDGTYPKPPGW
ncbi:WXG100-like domain-containing protein [Nocardia sp. NPDC055002]